MAFAAATAVPFGGKGVASSRCARRPARVAGAVRMAAPPTSPPKAMHDRVFVAIDEAADSTAGGLVLASSLSEKKEKTGVVIDVGPGRYSPQGALEPMPFAVGDKVLWKDDFGSETVEIDGKNCIALRVPSIVAKW